MAGDILAELKAVHAEIEKFLDELETLTGEREPQMAELATTRLNLTRASRRRTTLLELTVYPALLSAAAAGDRERVQSLRDEGKQRQIASADHIGRWTLAAVEARWRDYCLASRTMRASMRSRIQEERRILYPLLQPPA